MVLKPILLHAVVFGDKVQKLLGNYHLRGINLLSCIFRFLESLRGATEARYLIPRHGWPGLVEPLKNNPLPRNDCKDFSQNFSAGAFKSARYWKFCLLYISCVNTKSPLIIQITVIVCILQIRWYLPILTSQLRSHC